MIAKGFSDARFSNSTRYLIKAGAFTAQLCRDLATVCSGIACVIAFYKHLPSLFTLSVLSVKFLLLTSIILLNLFNCDSAPEALLTTNSTDNDKL